ncbi:MAG: hypothetical protein AAB672_02635 [Patescibacteria group bacterium]
MEKLDANYSPAKLSKKIEELKQNIGTMSEGQEKRLLKNKLFSVENQLRSILLLKR